MTEETNQLTKKLREEQRKEFLNLKQTCEKKHSDHQDVWDMLRENQRLLRESSIRYERERREADEREAKRDEKYRREQQEADKKYRREQQEADKKYRRKQQEADKRNEEYERKRKAEEEEYERKRKAEKEEYERERKAEKEKYERERKAEEEEYERKRKAEKEEYERKQQEADERHERFWQKFEKKMDRMHEEAEKQNRELREQMKVTDMKIQEISRRFTSTTGHIIEGLMSSASMEMFQKAGFDVYNKAKNLHHKNKSLNAEMEIDVLLTGDTTAVVIEVKASCDRKDVDHVLKQMGKFRLLYPEYHDKEVVVAIAAINYELDADIYAHEKKLVVVRADSRNVFKIDPYNMDILQRF
ncbi:MAG: hypothetical protein K5846_03735 [Bacteroidales bacterium]|nr:hypothetical protein [Bacteroidales bacterium]